MVLLLCFIGIELTRLLVCLLFLFKDTATTDIYTYSHTLSLHDALPISTGSVSARGRRRRRLDLRPGRSRCRPVGPFLFEAVEFLPVLGAVAVARDRKSTRLNSSH